VNGEDNEQLNEEDNEEFSEGFTSNNNIDGEEPTGCALCNHCDSVVPLD